MEGQEQGPVNQKLQINCQPELQIERNQSGNPGVLQTTSGNAAKRRATTRAEKSAEAAIKQIATRKLYSEKERIREWKQVVMQEVARQIQTIKQAYEEEIEAQRYSFQIELEKAREELQQAESRSNTRIRDKHT